MRSKLLLGALLLAACSSDDSNASVDGTYTLHTVNGNPLPALINTLGASYVTDGAIILKTDGTYSSFLTDSSGSLGAVTGHAAGAYTLSGSLLILAPSSGTVDSTTFSDGNKIVLTQSGVTFLYQK